MSEPLKGKRIAVLGGTSGLGRALALGMAEAGADVAASSRDPQATQAVTTAIQTLGRTSFAHPVDVTSRSSIETFHAECVRQFAEVDVLVNCAGVTKRVPTLECTDELWNGIFDVNVNGTLRACQIFGREMVKRGSGRIINIASLSSFASFLEVAPYAASKAAVASLTKSLAIEWARHGVLVNAIAPGVFPTSLNSALLDSPRGQELLIRTPMARFGEPHELVSTAIHLASDATTFTTGQILVVDGGFLASAVNQ